MSRIPDCENMEDWARAMFRLGLAFHLDDDPREIVEVMPEGLGPPLFTEEECLELDAILHNLTEEEVEIYHQTIVDEIRRANGIGTNPLEPWRCEF